MASTAAAEEVRKRAENAVNALKKQGDEVQRAIAADPELEEDGDEGSKMEEVD